MNRLCARSVATVLAVCVSNIAVLPSACAALISTEQVAAADRSRIDTLLTRPEIRNELVNRGISPDEARDRVAALSDDEVRALAGRLDQLPAGATDALGVVLVVFIVLLITDILGFTKIFSFTRPIK